MTVNNQPNPFEFSEPDTCRKFVTHDTRMHQWWYLPEKIQCGLPNRWGMLTGGWSPKYMANRCRTRGIRLLQRLVKQRQRYNRLFSIGQTGRAAFTLWPETLVNTKLQLYIIVSYHVCYHDYSFDTHAIYLLLQSIWVDGYRQAAWKHVTKLPELADSCLFVLTIPNASCSKAKMQAPSRDSGVVCI